MNRYSKIVERYNGLDRYKGVIDRYNELVDHFTE